MQDQKQLKREIALIKLIEGEEMSTKYRPSLYCDHQIKNPIKKSLSCEECNSFITNVSFLIVICIRLESILAKKDLKCSSKLINYPESSIYHY